jgi:hypothetical protein
VVEEMSQKKSVIKKTANRGFFYYIFGADGTDGANGAVGCSGLFNKFSKSKIKLNLTVLARGLFWLTGIR